MFLTAAETNNLDEASLTAFIERKLPEGRHLDYKAALSGNGWDNQAREFLKDVTAFANAGGGHLLIGVKEPDEKLSASEQMIGLDDGFNVASKLENLSTSSIDPRISGLLIRPIEFNGKNSIIVVRVPPSLSRPHMAVHGKHRGFYIRHTEKSTPMSTHEIREAVIASSSTEARANLYLKKQERDCLDYGICKDNPTLLIQAYPLIPPEVEWDVLGEDIANIVYSGAHNLLRSKIAPVPTINGVYGANNYDDPNWSSSIHRNGYVQAAFRLKKPKESIYIHPEACRLFGAFCEYVNLLLTSTKTDVPFLIRCRAFNVSEALFVTDKDSGHYSDPYKKDSIEWPDIIRNTGEDFGSVSKRLCRDLHTAFGVTPPSN
jgi:hypothetical protein